MIKRKTFTKKITQILAVSMAVMTLFACGSEQTNDDDDHHPLHTYNYGSGYSMSSSASACASTTQSASAPSAAQSYGGNYSLPASVIVVSDLFCCCKSNKKTGKMSVFA